ncbi:MAG: fibronectin type III domain-containing protein, partial [Gammaproteobacteria bacterium]
GSGELLLEWIPPLDSGGTPLRGYTVRWALSSAPNAYLNLGGADGVDVPGGQAARMHTITGLPPGNSYKVQVAAVNAAGPGAWSAARQQTAIPRIAVCLGAAAIPGLAECEAAAAQGYSVIASSGRAQTIFLSVALSGVLPTARTYTLSAAGGDNAITADVDIEGGLPFAGATVEVAANMRAGSTSVTLTAKAGGDGGQARLGFVSVTRASYQPGLFTLIQETLDVNQSGGQPDWRDGVIIARYLAGIRGADLNGGLGGNPDLDILVELINAGMRRSGGLDVDGNEKTTLTDGIMLARYLLGVRGAPLTAGMSAQSVDMVVQKIEALLAP